jgi:hypothetical protein
LIYDEERQRSQEWLVAGLDNKGKEEANVVEDTTLRVSPAAQTWTN